MDVRYKPKKNWLGFVPQYIAYPTHLCAHYHCPRPRIDGRRWCEVHTHMYDLEAKSGVCKILPFKQS